jgi:exodeoxyribonuclease-3
MNLRRPSSRPSSFWIEPEHGLDTKELRHSKLGGRRLHEHAKTLVDLPHPVALIGDYNVVPTDEDIYDAKGWRRDALLQPESREAFFKLLNQGWTDSLLKVHGPGSGIYTFWDYFRQHAQRDRGLRIDHILLNSVLAKRLRTAGVDRWVRGEEKPSDHAPTWIQVDAD